MDTQLFYRFVKIDLIQFTTFDCVYSEDEKPKELSSSFQFSYDFDSRIVCCTTQVELTSDNKPMLIAELNSYFEIQPESVEKMTEDSCVILPTNLMTQFACFGYGTMRGILYAKTMGTPWSQFILPPNDVQKVITTPAKFSRLNPSK